MSDATTVMPGSESRRLIERAVADGRIATATTSNPHVRAAGTSAVPAAAHGVEGSRPAFDPMESARALAGEIRAVADDIARRGLPVHADHLRALAAGVVALQLMEGQS